MGKPKPSPLDGLTTDLTAAARADKLPANIAYAQEIERVIQILCRRQKNNPFLLSESSPNRRAIVVGLAQKIVAENVPDMLLGKRILNLPVDALISGTTGYAEFEMRLKTIIEETRQRQNCILFIDEFHTLVGGGQFDGATIFVPALARGEIQLIGAATLDDYRQYVEKDPALQRRFQDVVVGKP